MGDGRDQSDWKVDLTGPDSGTVSFGPYRARFTVTRAGVIKMIWSPSPDPARPDAAQLRQAAYAACDDAVNG